MSGCVGDDVSRRRRGSSGWGVGGCITGMRSGHGARHQLVASVVVVVKLAAAVVVVVVGVVVLSSATSLVIVVADVGSASNIGRFDKVGMHINTSDNSVCNRNSIIVGHSGNSANTYRIIIRCNRSIKRRAAGTRTSL